MDLMLIFVYGTLQTDEPNHYLLQDPKNGKAKLIGKGLTASRYPLVVSSAYNIPFMLDKPGHGNMIEGEIYRIDQKMLQVLDALEGHPEFYTRTPIDITIRELGYCDTELPYSARDVIQCNTYIIKNFRNDLLNNELLTHYTSYHPKIQAYILHNERSKDGQIEMDYEELVKSVHQSD